MDTAPITPSRAPWYRRTVWIVVLLFLFPPAGAVLAWLYRPAWPIALRIILGVWGVIGAFYYVGRVAGPAQPATTAQGTPATQEVAAPTATAARAPTPAPTAAPAVAAAPTTVPPTSAPLAAAPAPCQYVRGFADFVKLVGPDVVGECRENEHPSTTTQGNIEQGTAKGLLVWNNAKRLAMFTDGATSWYGCGATAQSAPSSQDFTCVTAGAKPTPGGTDLGAITACEKHVAARLKAPSTAKYSGWMGSSTLANADGSTTVSAYVDAQNAFGAMIRNQYLCKVGPDAGNGQRPLLSLSGLE